jgi:hypothetical protein
MERQFAPILVEVVKNELAAITERKRPTAPWSSSGARRETIWVAPIMSLTQMDTC